MKEIQLTQGKTTTVDDEDFEWASKIKWNYHNGYARRNVKVNGKSVSYFMHRIITNAPGKMEVDHIDGNTLNNQRKNLRVCTTSQNQANRPKSKNNTSGYKGVSWHKKNKKWFAQVNKNGKRVFGKYFESAEEAAEAYKKAAIEHFGEFAKEKI